PTQPPPRSLRCPEFSWLALQPGALIGWDIVEGSLTAELQRAYIGDDRPAIPWRHAGRIGIHCAMAVGDDVEEILVFRGAQPIVVIAGRARHAALDDDAGPVAARTVARRAENAEALAPAR